MGDQRRVGDDPANPPTGHGMGFRQAADHHAALGHARQRRQAHVVTLERQAFIDLVHHHPQVMGDGEFGDGLQLFAVEHHAGGIVRVGQENRPGPGRDGLGQHRRIDTKIIVRRARHPHQCGAGSLERCFVGHVHRVEGNHFVTGAEQAHRSHEQGVLRARHGNHVFSLQFATEQLAVARRNGFAQRQATSNFGVVSVTFAQRVDGGIGDEVGSGEIRVADTENDHILAPAARFECRVVNIPGGYALT
ncbi:hypothetical protein D3C71_632260 [compost metagenome]